MNTLKSILFTLIIGFLFIQSDCNQEEPTNNDYPLDYIFLDKTQGQLRISNDSKENYFKRVNALDISIQLAKPNEFESRDQMIESYKTHLHASILEFNEEEQNRISGLFEQIKTSFSNQNIKPYHKQIYLSKIDDSVYGAQAFFTREDVIFIPDAQLAMEDSALKSILLHEIFHIYSRYNESLKSEAYGLIGFKKLDAPYKVVNNVLSERLLLNPDGLDNSYGIELQDENQNKLTAVSILHSRFPKLKDEIEDYFSYIHFELFRYDKDTQVAVSDDILQNDIPPEYFNSFFEQIADNTQYIIHPDEIMADNFMLMINANDSQNFEHFSESGTIIINKLHKLMSNK